jgi:pre-mRNA-splicing factor ISY1
LGEHAIRDLNDTINKLLREKYHWNRRIKELGGKDFNQEERKAMILAEREGGGGGDVVGVGGDPDALAAMGLGLKGSGGYRYFGAARDLPGVKELFARAAAKSTKRKRGDIYKYITPDYYGLRDEEDGVLLELEGQMAAEKQEELKVRREEYREMMQQRKKNIANDNDDGKMGSEESSDDDAFFDVIRNGIEPQAVVPSRDVVAQVLLQKKKEALLNRFA